MPADAGEKTEAPTPRRREEARRQGQVARSQDLSAAVMFLGSLIALHIFGPRLWHRLVAITQASFHTSSNIGEDQVGVFCGQVAMECFKLVAPIMLIMSIAGLITLYGQIGWLVSWESLSPSLSKINPLNGLKRIFSFRSVATALISFGKLAVVVGVVYLTLHEGAQAVLHAFVLGPLQVFGLGAVLTLRLGYRLAVVMLIMALIDYAYQKYKHEKDLKMTKEEVKDEMRNMEGDPVIKRRRREVQMQLAAQRVRQDMQGADVVVTNPTHLAIALRYDPDTMPAPRVVAKGADYLALRIRQIAQEFGVPIVERRALARAMYDVVEPGQYIPERFYQAIAEILAYVYELSGARKLEPAAAGT